MQAIRFKEYREFMNMEEEVHKNQTALRKESRQVAKVRSQRRLDSSTQPCAPGILYVLPAECSIALLRAAFSGAGPGRAPAAMRLRHAARVVSEGLCAAGWAVLQVLQEPANCEERHRALSGVLAHLQQAHAGACTQTARCYVLTGVVLAAAQPAVGHIQA